MKWFHDFSTGSWSQVILGAIIIALISPIVGALTSYVGAIYAAVIGFVLVVLIACINAHARFSEKSEEKSLTDETDKAKEVPYPFIYVKASTFLKNTLLDVRVHITNGEFRIDNVRVDLESIYGVACGEDYASATTVAPRGTISEFRSVPIVNKDTYFVFTARVYYNSTLGGELRQCIAEFRFNTGDMNHPQNAVDPLESKYLEGTRPPLSGENFTKKMLEYEGAIDFEAPEALPDGKPNFIVIEGGQRKFLYDPIKKRASLDFPHKGQIMRVWVTVPDLLPTLQRHRFIFCWQGEMGMVSSDGVIKRFPEEPTNSG